ncbi:hypothetical protein ISN45_At05g001660 [Arabidopsis thaliana x Arabidopsis arenosa]|uniref:Uncharacterized protein n=3 Tax=Arabidopsis TaxID=3701 RepID=F4KDR7_ARATH|nr:uncharacterized protein AT5G02650 [Arabidopsis thaliana]AED90502.1 hypothetical protein AT5G02650 [Arabidopsis thaliana]KAG7600928.1 hypothetical protein ISN45_At05g001660 [Arabidopsis thaliana x Arabidopsis arenosa]KAG7607868.1 hypothetical protein ISN44_As05g001720 [Arabidopsis suecica]|eukprot:NP_195885.4 hypothetical protein AT5G02650 [Arabidopsis thaliana]
MVKRNQLRMKKNSAIYLDSRDVFTSCLMSTYYLLRGVFLQELAATCATAVKSTTYYLGSLPSKTALLKRCYTWKTMNESRGEKLSNGQQSITNAYGFSDDPGPFLRFLRETEWLNENDHRHCFSLGIKRGDGESNLNVDLRRKRLHEPDGVHEAQTLSLTYQDSSGQLHVPTETGEALLRKLETTISDIVSGCFCNVGQVFVDSCRSELRGPPPHPPANMNNSRCE